ncbi:hypothetical protein [Salinisphaera sp. T5B8]|uniref:hypothetical protein n=1 Tax=Salinisphaera sp. T5B8 TaxID=1304154 RepID=UPI003342C0E7
MDSHAIGTRRIGVRACYGAEIAAGKGAKKAMVPGRSVGNMFYPVSRLTNELYIPFKINSYLIRPVTPRIFQYHRYCWVGRWDAKKGNRTKRDSGEAIR